MPLCECFTCALRSPLLETLMLNQKRSFTTHKNACGAKSFCLQLRSLLAKAPSLLRTLRRTVETTNMPGTVSMTFSRASRIFWTTVSPVSLLSDFV